MARLSGWATQLTGSFGDVTAYQLDGTTIIKQKPAPTKKHEFTEAQLAAMVRFANNVIGYRHFKGQLKPAFEIRKPRTNDYTEFMRLNRPITKVCLTKQQVEQGACVAEPWFISNGTLADPLTYEQQDGRWVSSVRMGDLAIDDSTTVGEFSLKLRTKNRQLISKFRRYQITFFRVRQTVPASDEDVPRIVVECNSVDLDEDSRVKLYDLIDSTDGFTVSGGFLSAPVEENTFIAWLLTCQLENGDTLCTTQRLKGHSSIIERYTSAKARDAAIKSYKYGIKERPRTPDDNAEYEQEHASNSGTGSGTGNTDPTNPGGGGSTGGSGSQGGGSEGGGSNPGSGPSIDMFKHEAEAKAE